MASEGWLYDAYFSGTPSHHTQPVISETEADVLNTIMELGTFWSSQAASWMNTEAAECSAQRQSPRQLELDWPRKAHSSGIHWEV